MTESEHFSCAANLGQKTKGSLVANTAFLTNQNQGKIREGRGVDRSGKSHSIIIRLIISKAGFSRARNCQIARVKSLANKSRRFPLLYSFTVLSNIFSSPSSFIPHRGSFFNKGFESRSIKFAQPSE